MNELFNKILIAADSELTIEVALVTMLCAVLLGVVISMTYKYTHDGYGYDRDFTVTLVMLPIILSVIIIFVGSDIARAFSLAGTLSIIRFRSAPGSPKDIGYIFFAIAAGLACGVGLYGYGVLFTVILCLVLVLMSKLNFGAAGETEKLLKITIPENLNYQGAFDTTLNKYTTKYKLNKIRTCDLGSLFELAYTVKMNNNVNEQEFLNDLRTINGNLNIILSAAPMINK